MDQQQMQAPKFKWEWNLNTVAVLAGFAAGFVAWGYTLADIQSGRSLNAVNIERLENRLSLIETTSRRLDNHELRLTGVEKKSDDGASALRAVETSINALASDMRLTREILERLEKAQAVRSVN